MANAKTTVHEQNTADFVSQFRTNPDGAREALDKLDDNELVRLSSAIELIRHEKNKRTAEKSPEVRNFLDQYRNLKQKFGSTCDEEEINLETTMKLKLTLRANVSVRNVSIDSGGNWLGFNNLIKLIHEDSSEECYDNWIDLLQINNFDIKIDSVSNVDKSDPNVTYLQNAAYTVAEEMCKQGILAVTKFGTKKRKLVELLRDTYKLAADYSRINQSTKGMLEKLIDYET